MKATQHQQLHDLGQSLCLDDITRGLLTSGTLGGYINEFSVTGLTSNPTIFEHAIKEADFHDDAIRQKALVGSPAWRDRVDDQRTAHRPHGHSAYRTARCDRGPHCISG